MNGGYSLCQGESAFIEPQCCCDLSNITDWEHAVEAHDADWQMLWIGHPHVVVKRQADRLIIRESQNGDANAAWSVPIANLIRAITTAKVEQQRFAHQLQPVLVTLGYRGDSELMSRKLAGLS